MNEPCHRLLLVDDDAALLDALPEMIRLRLEGIQVDTSNSALDAVEKLQRVDYDALISDIKMPGMDGLGLLSESSRLRPDMPVLLITGHGEHENSVDALRGGAFDFISKPIDRNYFAAAVERAIGVRSLRRTVAAQNDELQRHALELEAEVARRTNEALQSAAAVEELAAIVSSSDDAIVSKDLNGIVRSWNPAAERMFGYTADEMIGRSITTIIPDDRLHEENEVLARVRSGRRMDHFETVRVRKNGTLIHVSLTVSPVKDHTGEVVGASKIARDISARVAAEEAMRESASLKDEFLSLVSHELRTPIAIISGNGHLLARRINELEAGDRDQAIADITFEAERLQRIIENLLLLTRVEGGEPVQTEQIRLDRVVKEAIRTVSRRSSDRDISLSAAEGVMALGDPTLTALVVENLVGNAIKYSAPGSPIEVSVEPAEPSCAVVKVMDRGIGLVATELEHVFAPFFRAEAAKQKAGGMGLGLAVCKKAVEEQGGKIGAAPRPGGGTEFWFTLVLADEPEYA